jgi:hypothetical protein
LFFYLTLIIYYIIVLLANTGSLEGKMRKNYAKIKKIETMAEFLRRSKADGSPPDSSLSGERLMNLRIDPTIKIILKEVVKIVLN